MVVTAIQCERSFLAPCTSSLLAMYVEYGNMRAQPVLRSDSTSMGSTLAPALACFRPGPGGQPRAR